MQPVVTPKQVKAVDEAALAIEPLEQILDRVGQAIASELIKILGDTYGKRINVLIGPGLNGADARVAVPFLERRGVRAHLIEFADMPARLPDADLTLDGLFGIGLDRDFEAPDPGIAPVVAVDISSGIDGLTGAELGHAFDAQDTITLMALKTGLLFGRGAECSGTVRVVDIGLDPGEPAAWLVDDEAVASWLIPRARDAHKWDHAVLVVAGSPGMTGASHLVSRAAMRTGAGYVHLDSAAPSDPGIPTEVVASLAGKGVRADPKRFAAAVVGPGLGSNPAASQLVNAVVSAIDAPVVIDGDGLRALDLSEARSNLVLTPHDGEYASLMGEAPGADRIAAANALAERSAATVVLKGPTTVVAAPGKAPRLVMSGDARLATAGTGDVLAGMIGALLARGLDPFDAAAAAAHIHGIAGSLGPAEGLIASDLPDLIPSAIEQISA